MRGIEIPIEDKRAYVERIEKKAKDENISIKLATEKLNLRYYMYQDYKRDLRLTNALEIIKINKKEKKEALEAIKEDKPEIEIPHRKLVLNVNTDVYEALEKEANIYIIKTEHIAQIYLANAVKKRIEINNKKEG